MAASRSNISPVSVAYVLRISNYSFKSTLGECMRWHEEYADRRLYTCSACHSCLPRSHVSERSCLRNIVDRRVQSGLVLSSRVGIMKRQFKTRQRRKFKFSFDGKNRRWTIVDWRKELGWHRSRRGSTRHVCASAISRYNFATALGCR